jgi:hypothetical protein
LSFRALARQLGLSAHSGLADYESGRRIPPEDLILAYERVFDVPSGTLKELRNRAFAQRAERRRLGKSADAGEGDGEEVRPPDGAGRNRDSTRRIRISVWAVALAALLAATVGALMALGGDTPSSTPVQSTRTAGTSAAPGIINMNGHGVQEPVRRIGAVILAPGYVIDLDSLSRDWALRKAPRGDPYDLEFTVAHLSLDSINNASLGVLPPGSAGVRKECGKLQAYNGDLARAAIRPGVLLCVITDQRRYALLRITSVRHSADGQPGGVTLSIRVWEHKDAS